ncbi:DUF1796 family putative cysteine peptidase [Bacillus sp. EB600]|uniref:DUF1796 family putative cysteine peptidase n=1 Tax=Bacillus sp. EB600 TaxID=2806345 RepID=UPI00210E771E|nr:peptidase [Bacillus sp. EB600]
MNLQQIKGQYDVIVSLGFACNTAMKLRDHNLRKFSGPIDWMVSESLSDVSRLLKNRFKGFMELENMRLLHGHGSGHGLDNGTDLQPSINHVIKDTFYNIVSYHDFPVIPNQDWTATYPAFKNKTQYRIERFMGKITNSQSVLFVRWGGSYEQAIELHSILSRIVKGTFNILILVPVEGHQGVSDLNWILNQVCAVRVPNLVYDDATWNYVLHGITVV